MVHAIVNGAFSTGRGGLPGNDDSGGLSSWYVWASLGLFPVAGQSLFFVNAPSFHRSRIRVAGGDFVIEAENRNEPRPGDPPQYVQSVTFNDLPLERTWITSRELNRPGHLVVDLGPEPSSWGTDVRPPSGSSRPSRPERPADARQRPVHDTIRCRRTPGRRLVIVVRADPVICGHSGEARNLAEAALLRGFDDVRIVTWPLETLGALPLKPLDSVLPYSPGITVERPDGVGNYKVPDGRYTAGMVGRLVELFCEDVPTVVHLALPDAPRQRRDGGHGRVPGARARALRDDHRRGGRLRHHERHPIMCRRGSVRRRRPRVHVVPRPRPLRRRVGVHART